MGDVILPVWHQSLVPPTLVDRGFDLPVRERFEAFAFSNLLLESAKVSHRPLDSREFRLRFWFYRSYRFVMGHSSILSWNGSNSEWSSLS
jgi:hypothetical protein